MNGADPGKFMTSTVTGGVGAVAGGMAKGALSGGFEGGLLGASIGSIIPGAGTLAGGLIGAGLGASFGVLTGASKTLSKTWDKLVDVSRNLIDTFAKFDPLITAQQERWKQLDMQMNKIWAKTLAPTLKHITDIGLELKERWTRLKVSVFRSWEGVINKLIGALGVLVRSALSVTEFFAKLTSLIMDLIKAAFKPLIAIIKLLWSGIKDFLEWLGFVKPKRGGSFTGIPKWSPGITPILAETGGGARGGTPLLRGKFVPGGMMPEWAKEGKMEFGWWKDLKVWLGGYLDKIITLLDIGKIGEKILPLTDPGLYKQYKEAQKRDEKYPVSEPATEEAREAYRRMLVLPPKRRKEKEEPTSSLGFPTLPGTAGMIQGALSMTALTSVTPEPKIRTERRSRARLATADKHEVELQRLEKLIQERRERVGSTPQVEEMENALETKREFLKKWRTRGDRPRIQTPGELEPETSEGEELPSEEEKLERDTSREPARARGYGRETRGNVILQVLDSNQLLDMLSFSWDEIRTVLRQQQAEYTLLKYRMQSESTYL